MPSRIRLPSSLSFTTLFVVACAAGTPSNPPVSPPPPLEASPRVAEPTAAPPSPKVDEEPRHEIPTACASKEGGICTLPQDFVTRLCGHPNLDVALTLFAKGSPWTRRYLRGNVDAWYTQNGASPRSKLVFDEEVLVLAFHPAAKGGMVINGSTGTFEVLRWDGYCYSLEATELTSAPPPRTKYPRLSFGKLSPKVQEALLMEGPVRAAVDKRRKECGGVSNDDVGAGCLRADAALSSAVVEHVRQGKALPPPERIP